MSPNDILLLLANLMISFNTTINSMDIDDLKNEQFLINKQQINSFQHYVPRFLLEYFNTNGYLWVYDRQKKEFRKQPPKTTAGEKAFYVFSDKKGGKNAGLEKMFSVIEGAVVNVIKELVLGKKTLDMQQKADLAMFLTALYLRVPESIKRSENMGVQMTKELMSKSVMFEGYFNKTMNEIEKKLGKQISPEQRKDIQKTFKNKNYNVVFPKGYALSVLLSNLTELYKIIVQMDWIIIRAPKDKTFISSDHPVYTFNPKPEGFWGSGIGLLAPNCETVAILTPKLAIYLSQKHNPYGVRSVISSSDLIDNFNFWSTRVSYRFVLSHNEKLLRRWIKRTKLSERGQYGKVHVG